jgi:hypothetical protein
MKNTAVFVLFVAVPQSCLLWSCLLVQSHTQAAAPAPVPHTQAAAPVPVPHTKPAAIVPYQAPSMTTPPPEDGDAIMHDEGGHLKRDSEAVTPPSKKSRSKDTRQPMTSLMVAATKGAAATKEAMRFLMPEQDEEVNFYNKDLGSLMKGQSAVWGPKEKDDDDLSDTSYD